jgi:alpha-tubulin suppressor-like RCC1 family protein
VAGGVSFAAVHTGAFQSAGGDYTCGVTASGAAYCWGSNVFGQLGNGSIADSPVPVAVVFP